MAGWFKFGRRERDALHAVNVQGTRNALEAALRTGVRTVYTSTVALNSDTHGEVVDESYRFTGRHLTEYDRTKGEAHDVALEYAEQRAAGGDRAAERDLRPGRHEHAGRGLPTGGPREVHPGSGRRRRLLGARRRRRHRPPARDGEGRCPARATILAGEVATFDEALTGLAELTGGRKPLFLPRWLIRTAARMNGVLERVVSLPQDQTREAMTGLDGHVLRRRPTRPSASWAGPRARLKEGFADTYLTPRR